MVDTERLAGVFVELADTLVDDFDVHDLLHVLAARCVDVLGVAAAGLLLTENGNDLRVVVSSSERAQLLELLQLQDDEGPCLDSYRNGVAISAHRLDQADTRWPRFATAATREGFTSVMALPLRLRGQVIGALNLFGTAVTTPLTDELVPIAQSLADVATIAILQDRLVRSRGLLNEQLTIALDSRITIEQAKGMLATRLDIGTDEAFGLLRSRARSSRRRLAEVADEVIRGGWTGYTSG